MADLKEKSVALLASIASVNLNSAASTNLYTVPTGKKLVVDRVVVRNVSADATNCQVSLGKVGATTDFMPVTDIGENLTGTALTSTLYPARSKYLTASDTWDPGAIADGDEEVKDVVCTGALLGDYAIASFSLDLTDLVICAAVTAADTVSVSLLNNTGGSINLGSGTVRVLVIPVVDLPASQREYIAAEIFAITVTTVAGVACTATVDVYGTLKDA